MIEIFKSLKVHFSNKFFCWKGISRIQKYCIVFKLLKPVGKCYYFYMIMSVFLFPTQNYKRKGQFLLKENFPWKSKWSNFNGWDWHTLKVTSVSSNKMATFTKWFRFPLKIFFKRNLTFIGPYSDWISYQLTGMGTQKMSRKNKS